MKKITDPVEQGRMLSELASTMPEAFVQHVRLLVLSIGATVTSRPSTVAGRSKIRISDPLDANSWIDLECPDALAGQLLALNKGLS